MLGYAVEQGVAIIEVAAPPLNALGAQLRASLMDALDRAERDDAIRAIVLIGADGSFPVGPDLRELETGPAGPSLADLCTRVSHTAKPVVAALQGIAQGGGLELALAAHYRVAAQNTRLGFPDIHMGLVPSGGASQRLPRIVDPKAALALLLDGRTIRAGSETGRQICDLVTDGPVRPAAIAYCLRLLNEGRGPRSLADIVAGADDPIGFQREIASRRTALQPAPDSAQEHVLALIEATALLPFEAGLAMEAALFAECLVSNRGQALRHLFRLEQAASLRMGKASALPDLDQVAVMGSGPLAEQLVMAVLHEGMTARWAGLQTQALQDSVNQVRNVFAQAVTKGKMKRESADASLSRLLTGSRDAVVKGADLVVLCEPGFEDMALPEDCPVLQAHSGPVRTLGLRFAPPLIGGRLVELLLPPDADEAGLAPGYAFARRLGKLAVVVRSDSESLSGRLNDALHRAADALVDAGASPYAVDAALRQVGWQRPPFEARDLSEQLARVRRMGGRNWQSYLAAEGRTGRKAGRGFYLWKEGRPKRSQRVLELIDTVRPPKDFPAGRLRRLLFGAVANEGVRLMAGGMVAASDELDLVTVMSMDMPRETGGIMKAVSLAGLFKVLRDMERFEHDDRAFWQPHPIWKELIKNGRNFDALTAIELAGSFEKEPEFEVE